MKKFTFWLWFLLVVSFWGNAQNAFWSNTGLVSIKQGAFLSIQGNAFNQDSGYYDNSDSIFITGNWSHSAANRCFDSIGTGWVYMDDSDQHITGTSNTHFYNLILQNQGVKFGDLDVYVDGQLNLTDRELRMDTNTVWVLNPDTASVQRTNGYVSSLQDGGLLRRTDTTLPYLFPVGSDSGTFRYRPVIFQPLAANLNHFKARFANVDPTLEGFDRNIEAPLICRINPKWYHRFYHLTGNDSAEITVMYDSTADGFWNDIVHWQNLPEWESIHSDTLIPGLPFNQLSKFTWNNYRFSPFAIAITTDSFAVAKNGSPYCSYDTIALYSFPYGMPSYYWTGPDSFTSTIQNPRFIAGNLGGTYTVTITNQYGCVQSASTVVIVNPAPIATAANTGPYCNYSNIVLSSGPDSMVNYQWSGVDSFVSGIQNPTLSANGNAGLYTVVVTDSAGCSGTATTNVVVNVAPSPAATNNGPFCSYDSIYLFGAPMFMSNYDWAGPGAFNSNNQNPVLIGSGNGGTYNLTVTDANGCTGSATTTVNINTPVQAVAGNTGPYCDYATISLFAQPDSNLRYTWAGPNGFNSLNQNPSLPANGNAGTYTLSITDNNDCTSSASTLVVVGSTPSAGASNNGPYCANTNITLSASPDNMNYYWSGPDSFNSDSQNPTLIATGFGGSFNVTVTDANGCSATASTLVTINPAPLVTAGPDTTIWKNDTIQLFGTGFGSTYAWTPDLNLSCTTCNNPYAWPDTSVTYYFTVTNSAGCSGYDSLAIIVKDRPLPQLFIPNAITPNGDGYNDAWLIRALDEYPVNEVRIINRWGDEVFYQSPYQNNWAGTWDGHDLPGGTYYYILRILYNGEYVKYDGPLTIIR